MRPPTGIAVDVDERAFGDLFAHTALPVRAYVRRYCAEADCDDVMSEVFLVAWRRLAVVPDDPLPWLLGTARRVLANHWRGRDRRVRLAVELCAIERFATASDPAGEVIGRVGMLRALAGLASFSDPNPWPEAGRAGDRRR